jgi:4'-phosphopantetheinyl transferase
VSGFPRATLRRGDVHVRYRRTACVAEDTLQAAVKLLSEDEIARCQRFHFDQDRREFALAHALLRTTLSAFDDVEARDWRFENDCNGKPAVAPGLTSAALSFNLSHSHGLVACVVTVHADVGVDVESVTRTTDWRSIVPRYFSAAEVAQIDRLPAPEQTGRFFELWTLKEAFAKALGVGLSQSLDATCFDLTASEAIACSLPERVRADAWQFALYRPAPEHRLAVAVSDGTPRRWRIDARASEDDRCENDGVVGVLLRSSVTP